MLDCRVGIVFQMSGDPICAAPELGLHFFIGLFEKPVDRGDHADDLLLSNLHAATDAIIKRVIGLGRRNNQVLSTQKQTGVLRSSNAFPAGERDKIKTHFRVIPKI